MSQLLQGLLGVQAPPNAVLITCEKGADDSSRSIPAFCSMVDCIASISLVSSVAPLA
jgi:hypothetical protein